MTGGIDHRSALAAATFFGSACLLIDQDRDTFEFTQFTLQTVHLGAIVKTGQGGKTAALNSIDIIRHKRDAANAFGSTHMGNPGW